MLMETLPNYPGVTSGLSTVVPMSPPATPPGDKYLSDSSHECSPGLFAETRYAPMHHMPHSDYDDNLNNNEVTNSAYDHMCDNSINSLAGLRISDRDHVPSSVSPTGSTSSMNSSISSCATAIGSTNMGCDSSSSRSSYHTQSSRSSLGSTASCSSSYSGMSSPRRKKSSKSSLSGESCADPGSPLPNANEEKRSRKDSFVYDVRMTNEQFLFFVPDLDLVKSHLMFAVREEVEVLKERIVELMDRINVLEVENNVLRQYATPEALMQVQNQQQQQQQQQGQQQQQNQHPTS